MPFWPPFRCAASAVKAVLYLSVLISGSTGEAVNRTTKWCTFASHEHTLYGVIQQTTLEWEQEALFPCAHSCYFHRHAP